MVVAELPVGRTILKYNYLMANCFKFSFYQTFLNITQYKTS